MNRSIKYCFITSLILSTMFYGYEMINDYQPDYPIWEAILEFFVVFLFTFMVVAGFAILFRWLFRFGLFIIRQINN